MTSGVSIGGIGAAQAGSAAASPRASRAPAVIAPAFEPVVLTPFRGPVGALVWIQAMAASSGPQSTPAGAARAYERAATAAPALGSISV